MFVAAGVALLVATLFVEGSSRSLNIGLVIAGAILALGLTLGVRRARSIAAEEPARTAGGHAPITSSLAVSAASVILTVGVCLGFAYLARTVSRGVHLGVDLGVVAVLVAAATLIYTGVL